jgi:hypothetical protein
MYEATYGIGRVCGNKFARTPDGGPVASGAHLGLSSSD